MMGECDLEVSKVIVVPSIFKWIRKAVIPRNESFTQRQYNNVPWERLGAEVLALSR